jgi:L-ascorbate metabolism protein UlaG (beta-lactamase superfamily)
MHWHHRFRSWLATLLLALSLVGGTADAHEATAEARYLANEAVLIAHGDTKVLFDAFYVDSFGSLALVPEKTGAAILAGTPPYDGIDAVFVSHAHGDHFTAAPTLAYLKAHPAVRLFAPDQVIAALTDAADGPDDSVLRRLVRVDVAPGGVPRTTIIDGLTIDAIAVPHAGGERFADVRNVIFRVSLGDWPTIMHLGDAAPDLASFTAQKDFLDAKRTNTALPPHWFANADTGKTILKDWIKADQVIAIHIPADAAGQGAAWRAMLGSDAFTDPGEVRAIER